jgi:hypothetical protein
VPQTLVHPFVPGCITTRIDVLIGVAERSSCGARAEAAMRVAGISPA